MQDSTQLQNEPNEARREMALGRCLVEGDPEALSRAHRRRRKALGLSVAIESVLLTFLVAAPLFTSIAQPNFTRPKDFQIVWGASHPIHSAAHTSTPVHNPLNPNTHAITFPTNLSPRRPEQAPVPEVEPTTLIAEPSLGDEGSGSFIFTDRRQTGPVMPPSGEIKKHEEKRPRKLSEPIVQAQLISRVDPRYPPLAILARVEGTVVLHAIISRQGRITSLEVASGPPLLLQAALDAVRQWGYRPTMLDGEPVEVETTITVVFRLQP